MTLRLPVALHKQLAEQAEKNKRSLNSQIVWQLEKEGGAR